MNDLHVFDPGSVGLSIAQSELAFPLNAIRPAMREKRRTKFNRVTRFELLFAEQLRGQFQGGDVSCVHIFPGQIDDAHSRFITNRRRTGAEPGVN